MASWCLQEANTCSKLHSITYPKQRKRDTWRKWRKRLSIKNPDMLILDMFSYLNRFWMVMSEVWVFTKEQLRTIIINIIIEESMESNISFSVWILIYAVTSKKFQTCLLSYSILPKFSHPKKVRRFSTQRIHLEITINTQMHRGKIFWRSSHSPSHRKLLWTNYQLFSPSLNQSDSGFSVEYHI